MSVDGTLKHRHGVHGDFASQSLVSMNILKIMQQATGFYRLSAAQQEALILIVVKIGRILTGNANELDHWHDIGGYSKLIENILNGRPANGVVPPGDKIGDDQARKESFVRSAGERGQAAGAQDFNAWKTYPGTGPRDASL